MQPRKESNQAVHARPCSRSDHRPILWIDMRTRAPAFEAGSDHVCGVGGRTGVKDQDLHYWTNFMAYNRILDPEAENVLQH